MSKCILTITLFVTLAALQGCYSQPSSVTEQLENLTPNMDGLSETYNENDAGIAVVNNENERMYVDDWRRAMLLDKPSMLSPIPVVQD